MPAFDELEFEDVEVGHRRRRFGGQPGSADPPRRGDDDRESSGDHARTRRWWVIGGVAAILALIGGVVATRGDGDDAASTTTVATSKLPATTAAPTSATTAPSTTTPVRATSRPTTTDAPTTSRGRVVMTVEDYDGPMLPTPTGVKIAAFAGSELVEIDVDTGRAVRIPTPAVSSGAPVAVAAGTDWVVVRPFDSVGGYVIRSDGSVTQLQGEFLQPGVGGGGMFLGPTADEVWLTLYGPTTKLGRVNVGDGQAVGPVIDITPGWAIGSDGRGGVYFTAVGRSYVATALGVRLVSEGQLVAVGPTTLLALECDASFVCATVLTDLLTGERRTVPQTNGLLANTSVGSISPDGTKATVVRYGDTAPHHVIIDLATGAEIELSNNSDFWGTESFVWSTDSRYLLFPSSSGRVRAYDTARPGLIIDLPVRLDSGPVSIAARPAPAPVVA
jgi:hypothetical protein